jgi:hypothetical protein
MPGCAFISLPVVAPIEGGVQISWEASCEGGGQILLGPDEHELKTLVYDGEVAKAHSIAVRNVSAGKTYFFRASVIDDDGTPLLQSSILSFTTAVS